jgi:hypothetical protein
MQQHCIKFVDDIRRLAKLQRTDEAARPGASPDGTYC